MRICVLRTYAGPSFGGPPFAAVLFLFFSALLPVGALASSRGEATLKRAVAYYQAARFRRSLRALRRGIRRVGASQLRARFELYIGLNSSVLGRKRAASAAFRRALIADPTLTLDPARFKPTDVMRFDRARAGLRGELRVTAANVDGARVWIDGHERGATPLTVVLPVGKHRVEVRRGKQLHRTEITVRYGAAAEVATAFAKAPSPKKPPRVVALDDAGHEGPRRQGADPRSPWSLGRSRLWTWIAAGAALAALGGGIGAGVAAKADEDEYLTTGDPGRLAPLRDSVKTKVTITNVMFGLSGALAVTAVLLYYYEGRGPRKNEPSSEDLSRWIHLGPTGVRIEF